MNDHIQIRLPINETTNVCFFLPRKMTEVEWKKMQVALDSMKDGIVTSSGVTQPSASPSETD